MFAVLKSMGEAAWREKEILALDYLKVKTASLPTELTSDAWLGGGGGDEVMRYFTKKFWSVTNQLFFYEICEFIK